MDKLPPELLSKICIQLSLEQRLECLRVCRSRWNVLDKYCLFHSVEVKNRGNHPTRMLEKFTQSPQLGATVKVVDLRVSHWDSLVKNTLFDMFPNARVMKVMKVGPESDSVEPMDTTPIPFINLMHSNTTVEHLSDFYHCDLLVRLLYSNLGGRLETLHLDLANNYYTSRTVTWAEGLPVLRKLILQRLYTTLNGLENLHENMPSIQDFNTEGLTLLSIIMPPNILPAASIKKFKFKFNRCGTPMMHGRFYQYATIKYSNATDIDYEYEMVPNGFDGGINYVYLNGFLDFLRLIAPHKNELYFHRLPSNVNPFEVLDAVDAHIKSFYFRECESGTLFNNLSQSIQSNCIEQLDMINARIDSIHLIANMTALTTLSITFLDATRVDLVDCLAACPDTLKTIYIECYDLRVNSSEMTAKFIQHLHIDCDKLTSNLGNIISFNFPNLVSLHLGGEPIQDVDITITSPYLQKSTYSPRSSILSTDSKYGFYFKSSYQQEALCYLLSNEKETPVEYDAIKGLHKLSFVGSTDM